MTHLLVKLAVNTWNFVLILFPTKFTLTHFLISKLFANCVLDLIEHFLPPIVLLDFLFFKNLPVGHPFGFSFACVELPFLVFFFGGEELVFFLTVTWGSVVRVILSSHSLLLEFGDTLLHHYFFQFFIRFVLDVLDFDQRHLLHLGYFFKLIQFCIFDIFSFFFITF